MALRLLLLLGAATLVGCAPDLYVTSGGGRVAGNDGSWALVATAAYDLGCPTNDVIAGRYVLDRVAGFTSYEEYERLQADGYPSAYVAQGCGRHVVYVRKCGNEREAEVSPPRTETEALVRREMPTDRELLVCRFVSVADAGREPKGPPQKVE
jgi:hypothetical protein